MEKSKNNQGDRFNAGKLNWGLVDWNSLEPLVEVLMFGATKYDSHNWKKGLPYVSTIESLLRHVFAFLQGEDIDKESGISHIGHIQCNAMFLSYYYQHRKDLDDRYIDEKEKNSE